MRRATPAASRHFRDIGVHRSLTHTSEEAEVGLGEAMLDVCTQPPLLASDLLMVHAVPLLSPHPMPQLQSMPFTVEPIRAVDR